MPQDEAAAKIEALLASKSDLDRRNAETLNMGSYERWTADALEALLKTVADQQARALSPAAPA